MNATPAPYQVAGLELASGLVIGVDDQAHALPSATGGTVRAALEAVLLEGLQNPPAVVAFSGGRDSSALLALAADLARRHGLALPVPATNTFPDDPAADETSWQEQTVRHLRLPDWHRYRWANELDLIGPVARPLLRQFGPVYPMNAHFVVPLAKVAQNGTLVTGNGGDQLFTLPSWWSTMRDARRQGRVGAVRAIGALPPLWARRRLHRVGMSRLPWLASSAQREVRRQLADSSASMPRRWADVLLDSWWRARHRQATERTLAAVVTPYNVAMAHPFMAPEVLRAAASTHPRSGYISRTAAMREIFGDLLPAGLLERASKATFNSSFFSSSSREFARDWDGRGGEGLPLDVPGLRRTWAAPRVDARSYALLQGLWCRCNGLEAAAG